MRWRIARRLARGFWIGFLLTGLAGSADSTLAIATHDGPHAAPPRQPERPGPALRAAIEAMEQGNTPEAERLLDHIAAHHPLVAHDAMFLQAKLRFDAGHYDAVIESAKRWQRTDTPLYTRFLDLLGMSLIAGGEEARARDVWDTALRATREPEERAALRIAIAKSHERSGDAESAVPFYLEVWKRNPTSESDETATLGLERLEGELGRTLRSGSDYRVRGDSLYRHRHNSRALADYDTALGLRLSAKERRKVEEGRAHTLFRLRRYTEASEAYAALPANPDRQIQHGRALARAGRVGAGIRELQAVGAAHSGATAARALLLAGLLREGEGEFAPAQALFRRSLERAPNSTSARAARWRLGWAAYRAGRLEDAEAHFDVLAREESDALAALRPRYWKARVLEQRAGRDASAEAYAEIAREFPLSYYGWRASQRVQGAGTPRLVETVPEGSVRITPADTSLPRILLEAGLIERAHEELDSLAGRARGLTDRLTLAQLFAETGDFNKPQRLVVDAYTEQLARGPSPAQLELWWHAWPAPFEREMQAAADSGASVPPQLVYAVMREESGYRPQVLSVSGARGLLQLMPLTAEKLASSAQLPPFEMDELFQPELNIRLGSDYLSELLRRFGGRTSAAIGSYNAGPQAVARWLQEDAAEDDAWVEEIPYNQTRAYVKRVLRSLHAYQVLY